tara:strand:- start:2425 stop:2580 length:156 start_codon:yes stop_codon:yes gene_type:complete
MRTGMLYIWRFRAYVARHFNSITRTRRRAADPTGGNMVPERSIAGIPKDMT